MLKLLFRLALVWVVVATFAVRASAHDYVQIFSDKIESEGYTITKVQKTWFGRVMIVSEDELHWRETVFDPASGDLLQDKILLKTDRVLLQDLGRMVDGDIRSGRAGRDGGVQSGTTASGSDPDVDPTDTDTSKGNRGKSSEAPMGNGSGNSGKN